jgi:putative addiction module killer protein
LQSRYGTIVNRNGQPIEIQYYRDPNGRQPFIEWFESIRDKITKQRIDKRLAKLEDGNLGDCRSVGGGVFELRLHFGPGYRIYFRQIENTLVLLLCGGDKKSQQGDIEIAKTYWREYKETHQ